MQDFGLTDGYFDVYKVNQTLDGTEVPSLTRKAYIIDEGNLILDVTIDELEEIVIKARTVTTQGEKNTTWQYLQSTDQYNPVQQLIDASNDIPAGSTGAPDFTGLQFTTEKAYYTSGVYNQFPDCMVATSGNKYYYDSAVTN